MKSRLFLIALLCAGLAQLVSCKGVGTVCNQSGSTSECGSGFICTYTTNPGTFDPNADPPPPLSVCLRTCNETTDCGEGELCRVALCSTQKSCQTGPLQDPPPNVCGCEYEQDFESLDATSPTALGDDGWLFFGNVFDESGAPKLSYPNNPPSPVPAPNDAVDPDDVSISAIASEEGGTRRGEQQLLVSNDYSCCNLDSTAPDGHGNGTDRVETLVYREINPIPADFIGKVYQFTFDGRRGNLGGATTAQAFIRTRQQQADGSFVTTNDVVLDTTRLLPDFFGTYGLSLDMSDPSLEGQRLQFGFSTIASNFQPAGNLYDNTTFCAASLSGAGGAGGTGGAGGAGGAGGTGGMPACDSEALAFITTLDPSANFDRTNFVTEDTTNLPENWDRYTISLDLTDPLLEGQILQVGFSATASNFEPSGVFYDNIQVDPDMQYTSNFEDPPYVQTDAQALGEDPDPLWGDGWIVFGNAFESDGTTLAYPYGPFTAPNNSGGFSGIALGQGGVDQGDQVLVIISDYNNADQGIGRRIQANTFRERTITASDIGTTINFSFDAKRGNINEGCPPPEEP